MRKAFLVLICGCAIGLAFALPGQAEDVGKYLGKADFNFRGWYMMIGNRSENIFDFEDTHAREDRAEWVFSRFRWWMDASFEGKYGGTIGLEWNWFWGQDASSAFYNPATHTITFTRGWRGAGHGADLTDQGRMKHAYVWFLVPNTPVKVTGGLQTFAIDPDYLMWGTQGDWWGVRVDTPVIKDILNLTVGWLKQDEGSDRLGNLRPLATKDPSDDTDAAYVLLTGNLLKWLNFGFYNKWQHVGKHGYDSFDPGEITLPVLGGRGNLDAGAGDYVWHGLWIDANPGIFYSRFHFNYFWGDMKDDHFNDVDPRGWAFVGRAGVKLGPFSVGLRGWYFTGNDDDYNRATRTGDWKRWTGGNDTFFAPFEIFYMGERQWQYASGMSQNPGGTAALCLESSWQATKKLSFHFLGGYIWFTEKYDKFALTDNGKKGAGFEADLRATYKIYDNLSLDLVGAYFIADKGLDHFSVADPTRRVGADDAYEVFWRLVFEF